MAKFTSTHKSNYMYKIFCLPLISFPLLLTIAAFSMNNDNTDAITITSTWLNASGKKYIHIDK